MRFCADVTELDYAMRKAAEHISPRVLMRRALSTECRLSRFRLRAIYRFDAFFFPCVPVR